MGVLDKFKDINATDISVARDRSAVQWENILALMASAEKLT